MVKGKAKKVVGKQKFRMFRSSLEQIVEIAERIREKLTDKDNPKPKHLEAMKNCPFWNFYRPFHEGIINVENMQKKHTGVKHILNTFDPAKKVFQLEEGKVLKSAAKHLAVIFGLQRIKGGAEEFTFDAVTHPNEGQKNLSLQQTEFLKTYFQGDTQMKKTAILDSLYATAGDVTKPDGFVKLLVLYFCVAIFFPRLSGASLPSKFLKYTFRMDQVSWPDMIHSNLLQALTETKKPYSSVRGCIMYILFWFAELTHCISKNEGELGKCKPRFARWDTWELAVRIENEGFTSLTQDLTGSFIDPLDEDEQRLMTPIEKRQANSDRIGEMMVSDRESDEDWELSPNRDAARHLEDLTPVYPFKKRKTSRKVSHPRYGKGICNAESENLPSSEPLMPAIPILPTQESGERENDTEVLHTTAEDLHGNDVHIGSFLSCSEAHTTGVELFEEGALVEEPVDATMNISSSNCQVPDSTLLLNLTSVDVSPFFEGFTSTCAQGIVEEFEFVDHLEIPEEYETLYKKIYDKYGHMASKKVIKFNDFMLLTCVTSLLKVISDMETVPGAELSEALLQSWEGFIKDAETLEFNVKWLREGFNRLKNHWMSSFQIDAKVESHEQVLVAMKMKYDRLSTRKDELESELSDVKLQIMKAEVTISSVEEAIQEMQNQKIKFQHEPVLGIVLS
ncbi:hypothetical protein MKW92_026079 [Papaver armeniacum]|nr:hypothetical protein MKW92_026079 [Papaver armeniacum]